MYFVMARLDAAKFCKLDFIVNFGVSPQVKTDLSQHIAEGGDRQATFKLLETFPIVELLKLHKYFFWADKKLHSVFFIEDKDSIEEDLLIDFRDEDADAYKASQQLGQKKQAASGKGKKNQRPETAVPAQPKKMEATGHRVTAEDLFFGADKTRKKYVDIKDDDDFPDLGLDDVGGASKKKAAVGFVMKEQQKDVFADLTGFGSIRPQTA